MFEQMLSILVYIGDDIRAGLLGGGKVLHLMPCVILSFIHSEPWM